MRGIDGDHFQYRSDNTTVIIDTEADPSETRTNAAITKARRRTGIPRSDIEDAKAVPTPETINICLKTPPAPVISTIIPAGASALLLNSRVLALILSEYLECKAQ